MLVPMSHVARCPYLTDFNQNHQQQPEEEQPQTNKHAENQSQQVVDLAMALNQYMRGNKGHSVLDFD